MKQQKPTTNILTPEQEAMRLQVVDLELKARYWKAQWEIRHYTLNAEALQPEYDTYVTKQKENAEKALQEYMAQLQAKQQMNDAAASQASLKDELAPIENTQTQEA